MTVQVQQLSAFPFEGRGGNPAGVVLNGAEMADSKMQEIASQVGHSETVFIAKSEGFRCLPSRIRQSEFGRPFSDQARF